MGLAVSVLVAVRRLGTIEEGTFNEQLERLEKDIRKLRDQLRLPEHGGPAGIVQEWTEWISHAVGEDGDRRAFAKRALEKLAAGGTTTQ